MTAFRTETVDTPAGVYTIELHYDEDSPNPLTDWDHEGMAFYVVGNRNGAMLDTLNDASEAGNAVKTWLDAEHNVDDIERRFTKWKAITSSPWELVTGNSFDWHESYGWIVLVDSREDYGPGDSDLAAHGVMYDFQTWTRGEVCGYVVKAPNDDDVESVWGFYDDDDALEQAKTVAEYDALDRLDSANLAGAGFIGIV